MQERTKSFYVVFAIAAALIVPAAIALRTVIHPAVLQATSDNPTPLGYSWSLGLFVVPIAALAWWFACRPDLKFPRKTFWRTIAVLTPVGFALDLLFGNAFFIFPNEAATLRCEIPALGGPDSNRRIHFLSDRLHARSAELHLVRRILDGRLQSS
jgi:hypothetical protein